MRRDRISDALAGKRRGGAPPALDQSDELTAIQAIRDQLLDDVVLRGVRGISKATARKIPDTLVPVDGRYVREETWVVDTVGTNLLDILALDNVDASRTYTNDIQEIHHMSHSHGSRSAKVRNFTVVDRTSHGGVLSKLSNNGGQSLHSRHSPGRPVGPV